MAKKKKNNKETMETFDKIFSLEIALDKQIPLIISKIEADPNYYKTSLYICKNLEMIVTRFCKEKLEVQLFGSASTKLALKNSDVDLIVNFKDSESKNFLHFLKRVICKGKMFYRPILIHAKTPILKCVHSSSISCDISVLNRIGFENNKLVNFVLNLDERLRPLILIIKFLMKKKVIDKTSMNSFSLIVLIIFFVQQLENPLIPPLCHLQNSANSKHMIENWNVSLPSDLSIISPSENDMSVPELIKNFLQFYSFFNFSLYIISSFTGKCYLKSVFENIETVPEVFSCYKENLQNNVCFKFENKKCMCVQDVFDHSNNITKNLCLKQVLHFQNFCQNKFQAIEKLYNTGQNCENNFFNVLFNHDSVEEKQTESKKANAKLYVGQYLNYENKDACNDEALKIYWCEIAINKLTEALVKILKCDVISYSEQTCPEKLKEFIIQDGFKYLFCEFHYIGLIEKIRNRARQECNLSKNMSIISREEIVTNYMCETILKEKKKESFKFVIQCIVKKYPIQMHLFFKCREKGGKRQTVSFDKIFKFLQNILIRWVQSEC